MLKHLLGQYHADVAAEATMQEQVTTLRFSLHRHKRRLAILECKLSDAKEQGKNASLCFGSSKLFRAQFDLEANGYETSNYGCDYLSSSSRTQASRPRSTQR